MVFIKSENLKKSRPKKLVISNKSISRILYSIAISKMAKNQSLKLPEMQFHGIFFFYLFDFTSFFVWTFINFLACCEIWYCHSVNNYLLFTFFTDTKNNWGPPQLPDVKKWNSVSSISISDDDDQEIQDEQCSEVEEKCEIISKEEVCSDVPGESCSEEVETDQDWETFEEV